MTLGDSGYLLNVSQLGQPAGSGKQTKFKFVFIIYLGNHFFVLLQTHDFQKLVTIIPKSMQDLHLSFKSGLNGFQRQPYCSSITEHFKIVYFLRLASDFIYVQDAMFQHRLISFNYLKCRRNALDLLTWLFLSKIYIIYP